MPMNRFLTSALCALTFSGNALAEEVAVPLQGEPVEKSDLAPMGRMSAQIYTYLHEELDDLLSAEQIMLFALVAKQKTLSVVCEGFEIDEDRFATVMHGGIAEIADRVEEGAHNPDLQRVMLGFATAFGGELAMAASDPDDFCMAGAKFYDEFVESETGDRYFVLADRS